MPRKANFIFEVRIRISEAFSLDSIVRSPRTFKPKDVRSACHNNELVVKSGDPPACVVNMATYVMTDFFAMAHSKGLYNRQKPFWESLSQVNAVHVRQLTEGVFKKADLPVFDFSFLDYKGKPLIMALLVVDTTDKKTPLAHLKSFIGRAQGHGGLTGLLACYCKPLPEEVLEFVRKQTHAGDPIALYESILPCVRAPLDLLECDAARLKQLPAPDNDSPATDAVFTLVHPDIKKAAQISELPRMMKKVMPTKKEASAEADAEPHAVEGQAL